MSEMSSDAELLPGADDKLNSSDYKMLEIKLKVAESTGNMGADTTDDFQEFDELFCGKLPCNLLSFDRKSRSFAQIRSFDELSRTVEEADESHSVDGAFLRTLASAPATRLAHFATLGNYLRHLYENDKLMDVCVDVGGTLFKAHRIALCCNSGYFSDLLAAEKNPTLPIRVKLVGISAAAFSAFLEFVYTGEVTIPHGIASEILLISNYLQADALERKLNLAICNLTLQEAVKLLLNRKINMSCTLHAAAFAKILDQFMAASKISGFLDLDIETLCGLLSSDNLRVPAEFEVFQIAIRWIVHGASARLQHVTRIMNLVRFSYMSQNELFNCLLETRLFVDYTELRSLILIANWVLTAVQLKRGDPFNFKVPPPREHYTKNVETVLQKNCEYVPLKDNLNVLSENASPDRWNSDTEQNFDQSNELPPYESPTTSSLTMNDIYGAFKPVATTCGQKQQSPRCYGKPLLVSPECMTSVYAKMPEQNQFQTRPTTVSPRYGKPILLQQELTKSSFSPHTGKPERKIQKRAISPAGHTKPTIWSQNANQSSNPRPELNISPPRSMTPTLHNQEMSNRHQIASSTIPVPETNAPRANDPNSTEPNTVEVQCGTNGRGRHNFEFNNSTHVIGQGQRYVISPLPTRPARPVMLPTDVLTDSDMPAAPEVSSHHFPLADIIVVGSFEETCRTEIDERNQHGARRDPIQYYSLPSPRRYFAVAMVAQHVYATGGYNPTKSESGVTNTVSVMDCQSKTWTFAEPMIEARMCHCACAVENNIYVFGGLGENERPLSSCECYNTCTNQWSRTVPLPVPIYGGAVTAVGGRCYIAGGLSRAGLDDSVKVLMTLVCFDPRSNKWTFKGSLRMPLCHASLVNVQGRLFVCGGATHRNGGRRQELQSVALIDEYNFINNTWNFRAEMKTPRHETSVAVVGSRLYVIGGKNSADEKVVTPIECYDTRDSAWIKCPLEMSFPARWINCVTYIDNKEN